MRTKQYLLVHPLFLLSLLVLLLNDFYLKYEFHNWVTGKLSDVAGLFAFTVFFIALLPNYKNIILICTGILFIWWKSPLSDPFIGFFNYQLSLPLHRVVDYTDLFALFVLPAAYRIKPRTWSVSFARSLVIYLVGIISFFSFCATSMPRYIQDDNIEINKSFRTRLLAEDIIEKFREKNIPIERDTAYYTQLNPYDKYLKIKDSSGQQNTIRIADHKEIQLYERTVPYSPTYTIARLVINNDTIKRVRFSIDEMYNRKKRIITLKSFGYDSTYSPLWMRRKFQKPIKQKIEEIIK